MYVAVKGGERAIEASWRLLDKARRVRAMIGDQPIHLQVDGGVTTDNAGIFTAAGADVLVAGTAVFKGGTEAAYRANIAAIRANAEARA